ncbi:hypothetical protein A8C56_14975 [Niabella ginsenosidivorans]|uniref:DinB-like domain-containing protein n=1 Tax=Niabella ginsenosidivorans TaxID=1176587 RepID=A0A1A9I3J3_9BACT|nr:DinB family protein [Niabella ginsenosidivorans]ANH82103.1 hypothetical protein A8C56_14975 [Niabella ginsenosidivorans]
METGTIDAKKMGLDFTLAANAFIFLLENVPQDRYNEIPFEGSWTPGQVADHVIKFLSGIVYVQQQPQVVTERPVDQYEPVLKEIFLDFGKKFNAPPNAVPGNGPFDRQHQVAQIKKRVQEIIENITGDRLEKLYTGVPFPTLAEFTGLEWICFGTYHLRRHTHQLEHICSIYQAA